MHLPRKTNLRCSKCRTCMPCQTSRRCSKCCACHTKSRLARTRTKVLQVLYLPRRANRRCSKCCACHAKRAGGTASAAVAATENEAAPRVINCRWISRTFTKVLQVLHLRRKQVASGVCLAKPTGGGRNAALATQNEATPQVINCRRTSADLYEGAPSAALATRNKPEVLQVLRQPGGDGVVMMLC